MRGPLVQQLELSTSDKYCTREQFTLLMLFLQGKMTEADLKECRAAFEALNAGSTGILSIRDLERVRQRKLLANPKLRWRVRRMIWYKVTSDFMGFFQVRRQGSSDTR